MFSANIVPAQDVNYYAIQNSFIHFALQGFGSLPITLGIIFTAIASRCGMSASPINYVTPLRGTSRLIGQPGHVYVAVTSGTFTSSDTFFVDVFNGGRQLSYTELSQPADIAGALGHEALRPASVRSMMYRVARNIVNAVARRPSHGIELPWFAALTCLSILEPDEHLRGRLCDFIRAHQSFVETDLATMESISSSNEIDGSEDHVEFCRKTRILDEQGPRSKRKTYQFLTVQYSVGQVFKHLVFQYQQVLLRAH